MCGVSGIWPGYILCCRALNGVLEMDGFKDTFRYLYGYNGTTQDSIDANFSANSDAVDTGKVCSSGNGAGLDALIVS